MRRLFEILRLEMRALVRSKALLMLSLAAVVWMTVAPHVLKGDGTAEGAREIFVHFSVGGVFALLVLALVSSATAALARERATKRLQLTLVRPVHYFVVALGKIIAHTAAGAIVLALAMAVLLGRTDVRRPCSHVLSPVLPSPKATAKAMYESYMKDTNTPVAVRAARRSTVMRLLTQKEIDRYETLATNATASWTFDLDGLEGRSLAYAARMRFTNQFDMRQDVLGQFRLAGLSGAVSNITQAVLTVPLGRTSLEGRKAVLSFENAGRHALMVRPRRDVNLLAEGDAFWRNALRAYLVAVSVLAAIVAFGVFLGAGLGRPVALFVAMTTLAVGEMSPSVVEQYPDQLETNPIDRIGLTMARAVTEALHPVSSLAPIAALAKDEFVEGEEVLRTVAIDLVAIPMLLAFLSALAMPRKQED